MDHSSPLSPNRRAENRDHELAPVDEPEIVPVRQAGSARQTIPDRPSFVPPISAIGPLFRHRFDRIHCCRVEYDLDINNRATSRVLGGYYKTRRLVRIYARDREQGLRPLEELFDTFLHEMAHHLEYTEPFTFSARGCGRVPGRMHSKLFWRILGELKYRWMQLQRPPQQQAQSHLRGS
jgi:hypothetical protein